MICREPELLDLVFMFHSTNDAGASTLSSSISFRAPAPSPSFQDSLRGPRQTVDLRSQDDMEDEDCEIAARAGHRGGIDHLENGR